MAYLLQQLLARSADRWPEKTAVWARGRSLSYRELAERSTQLAGLLRACGLRKGDRVGLYFPKQAESVVAMLGVLKAGGVYVPLDPHAPAKRVAYIVENSGMNVLVTDEARRAGLQAVSARVPVCVLVGAQRSGRAEGGETIAWESISSFPASRPPDVWAIESDLAYVLYTSGSSGEPKGVMLSHRNALTFVDWCAETFAIQAEDRLANHAPLHFDVSVFDVYNALGAGATIHMVDEEMSIYPASVAAFMESQRITVWYSVPSALIGLVLHGGLVSRDLSGLRLVLFAGEVFPMKYLQQLATLLPQVELYNLYGPTETNVCTSYRIERWRLAEIDKLPIGAACANTEVFAVDDQDRPIEPGGVGELYVRGPSVTSGYWGDNERTRGVVLSNRFQANFEEKMYRTGDLVRLEADGNYVFLGRRDSMIKSRGYRIDLGDIEAALYSHPRIREAAVVAIPDEVIGNRLKAFVAPNEPSVLTRAEVLKHCAERIPRYMIPEAVEFCANLPKTSTGKVDRSRLAQRE